MKNTLLMIATICTIFYLTGCSASKQAKKIKAEQEAEKRAYLAQLKPVTEAHYWIYTPDVHRPDLVRITAKNGQSTCDIYLRFRGEEDSIAFYTEAVEAFDPSVITHVTDPHGTSLKIHFFGFMSEEDFTKNRKFVSFEEFNNFQWYVYLSMNNGLSPSMAFKFAEELMISRTKTQRHGGI